MVKKASTAKRKSAYHRASVPKVHTKKRSNAVRKRVTATSRKPVPSKVSKARSQQARKMNRNPDGTFAKTKKASKNSSSKPIRTNKATGTVPSRNKHSITYSTKGFTPKMMVADKVIDTSQCTSATRKKVLSAVADNFTKDELNIIAESVKPVVVDRESGLTKGKVGGYARTYTTDKVPIPEIKLALNSEVSTITHEFIHHLRTIDGSRQKYAKTAYPVDHKFPDNGTIPFHF